MRFDALSRVVFIWCSFERRRIRMGCEFETSSYIRVMWDPYAQDFICRFLVTNHMRYGLAVEINVFFSLFTLFPRISY